MVIKSLGNIFTLPFTNSDNKGRREWVWSIFCYLNPGWGTRSEEPWSEEVINGSNFLAAQSTATTWELCGRTSLNSGPYNWRINELTKLSKGQRKQWGILPRIRVIPLYFYHLQSSETLLTCLILCSAVARNNYSPWLELESCECYQKVIEVVIL